jgi:hypothetical protein
MRQSKFSYSGIRSRRDKIFSRAISPYVNAKIVGDTVYDLYKDLLAELPENVSQSAVFDSIRIYAGTDLLPVAAKALAWRLAGNIDKLILGAPVIPWAGQIADERVPVIIEDVKPFTKKNVTGVFLYCRAVAGSPCPMLFSQFFSSSSCSAVARTLGFSAPWGPYPYATPTHLSQLLFFAHVEAEKSRTTPVFTTVSASSSMVKANREKIEIRCRAKPCPSGYEHPCTSCWVGHDKCPAAVHAKTFVTKHCPSCAADKFFDPAVKSDKCIHCTKAANKLATTRTR